MTTWRLDSMWTRTLSTTISTRSFCARGSSLAMPGLSHAVPARRPPAAGAERPDEEAHDDAGDEAADVGEERDLVASRRWTERPDTAQKLEDEPEHEDHDGRDVDQ